MASEESRQLQEQINKLIQDYLGYELEIGTSQELRNQREQEFREKLAAAGENQAELNALSANLSNEVNKSRQYAQSLGDDFNYVRSSLDDTVNDLGTSGDLGRQILKSFRGIRDLTNKIRDDRDLTNALDSKGLEKLKEKLTLENSQLTAQVTRGAEQLKINNLTGENALEAEAIIRSLKEGENISANQLEILKNQEGAFEGMSTQDKARFMSAVEFGKVIVDVENKTTHLSKKFKIINDELEKSIEREKTLNKTIGLTGEVIKGLSKLPGLSAVFKAEDIEAVKQELRETGEEGNRSLAMSKMLQKSFSNLKDALTDPAAIFTFLVTKGLQFNSEVTNLSKGLGVTETQATRIRNEFTSISANTMDTAVNTERLLKAQSDLNKELSLGVQFSGDTLVNFVRLTEKIGLSAQQAAKLTLASASTGESATEFAGKSALAAAQQAKTLGITVNMKEIMSDTADLTNEQLILFGRQPEAIGKALAEVKKLGIELGDLNAISSKLLDFQGSIESELEAELITGKQLNLERARAAALAGDQATLAKEIASQVGTIGEFESMNVLQRQKMAEALGMNVNQLSGVLIRQEAINKGISDAKDLTDEQLTAAKQLADSQDISLAEAVVKIQEQRSAQDKFNDAVQKLQRLFGELLGGPVGELLDALVDVASVVIGPVAAALNFILTPVKMLTTLLTKVPNILKVIAAGLIALNFSGISASVGGLVSKIGGLGKSIGGLVSKAGDLGGKLVSGLSSGGSGVKGFFEGIRNSFAGIQNQAAGIEFDPRMAGGGRFRDMASGRMVSEEAANTAGVFRPGTGPAEAAANAAGQAGDSIADISPVTDDGSMLKKKMKNIAEGLKSFASMEVVKGALALTIASPGLFILSKAADGLNKLGEVKGEALQEAMKGIAEGVEKFGTVRVVLGSIGLILASPGLVLLSMSVGGLKNLAGIGAETTKEAMSSLADGVGEFGSVSVIAGAIGLTIASPGLVLLGISTKGLKSLSEIDTNTTKEAMGSIAEGIGKFASMTVVGGAIGLTLAAPGLLLLGVSSLGLKAVESLNSEAIKESMASISKGVAEFSKSETLLGGLGLLAVAPGILTLAIASPGIAIIGAVGNLAEQGLKALGRGIGFFGDNLVRMLKGSLALTALSVPIAAAAAAFSLLKGVDVGSMIGFSISLGLLGGAAALLGNLLPQILMGAIGLAAVGAAIIPAALAFSLLEGIDIGAMFGFVGALTLLGGVAALLGNIAPFMLAGAVGIAAVGLAIIPAAAAFSMLEGLDPTAMLGFAAALGILGATAAGLSLVGPAIIIGAAALTALSFALIPISKILAIASPGIQTFNDAIKSLDPSQLLGLAGALPALALGLTFFGASLGPIVIASVGLLILGKALSPIAEMAPKLDLTSTSLKGIATSVALLATSLNTLDAAKLETLSDFEGNINISSVTASTTDQASVATNTATNTVDQASVATNTATNTVDQASVATNTATNTVDQVNTTTSTINEPVNSLANLITKQNTPDNTEIIPGISVTTPPSTTTQEALTTNTENLATTTSNATTSLEEFTAKVNASNLTERTKQQFIDVKTRSLDIKPEVEIIDLDTKNTTTSTVDQSSVASNTTTSIVDQPTILPPLSTVTQENLVTGTENLSTSTSEAAIELETFTEKINSLNISESAKQTAIRAKANALGVNPYTEAEVIDLDAKKVTNEIVPGISVTTPPVTTTQQSSPATTTQETLTTSTENLSTSTSNAISELEIFTEKINALSGISEPTKQTAIDAKSRALDIKPEVEVIDLDAKKVTNEIVPGISVATPDPETPTPTSLERILTLNTNEINTAIGLLNSSKNDRSSNLDTLDILKAQTALVDLRDGQQDIPTEKFSTKSLKIVESIVSIVSKLGADTEFQQVGENFGAAEINNIQNIDGSTKEERIKFFKPQSPETSNTIESPKSSTPEQTEDSQVFIDNIQPMIAETVTSTINAMLPPMVAALKEGQGKVKVVNDNFNASGQKGDINTIRRLPSDNFA